MMGDEQEFEDQGDFPAEEFETEDFAEESYAEDAEFGAEEFETEEFAEEEYGETYDEAAYEDEDFSGDDFGDEEYSDDEWADDEGYEDDDGQSSAGSDKKKKLTNVVVLGIAGIVGLGIMYMQMGGGGTTQKPPVATQVAQPKAQPTQQAQNTQVQPPQVDKQLPTDTKPQVQPSSDGSVKTADMDGLGGLLHNPDGFDSLTDDDEQDKTADDQGYFPDNTDIAAVNDLPQPPPIENKAQPDQVKPATDFQVDQPQISDQVLPDVAPVQTADKAANGAGAAMLDSAALDEIKNAMKTQTEQLGNSLSKTQEAMADLTSKLETIAGRLDAMESEIKLVKTLKSAAPASGNGDAGAAVGGASAGELAKLEEAIIYLDKQLQDSLSAQSDQIKAMQTAQDKKISALRSDLKKDMEGLKTASVAPKTTPSKPKKSAVSSAVKPAAKSAPVAKKPAVSNVRWVLKAAMPGQAYVARKGSADILQVTVGDKLPGIGRITKISMANNRWVVKGTAGSIHQ